MQKCFNVALSMGTLRFDHLVIDLIVFSVAVEPTFMCLCFSGNRSSESSVEDTA
jgi:hypothetical protein